MSDKLSDDAYTAVLGPPGSMRVQPICGRAGGKGPVGLGSEARTSGGLKSAKSRRQSLAKVASGRGVKEPSRHVLGASCKGRMRAEGEGPAQTAGRQ